MAADHRQNDAKPRYASVRPETRQQPMEQPNKQGTASQMNESEMMSMRSGGLSTVYNLEQID